MMTETVVTVQEAPHNNAAKPAADNQTTGGGLSWLRINVDYWRTLPGMLKIAQLVSDYSSGRYSYMRNHCCIHI